MTVRSRAPGGTAQDATAPPVARPGELPWQEGADAAASRHDGRSHPLLHTLPVAVASALVPGSGQAVQRRWRPALLFGLASATAAAALASMAREDRSSLVTWTIDESRLHLLVLIGVAWAVICAFAAVDAVHAATPRVDGHPRRRVVGLVFTAAVAVAALVPGGALGWLALRQDTMLDRVFATDEAVVAQPSTLDELGITTSPAEVPASSVPTTVPDAPRAAAPPDTTAAPPDTTVAAADTTVAAPPDTTAAPPDTTVAAADTSAPALPGAPSEQGRWTIALLGGDAGPHRWGLRTDTMVVVSIDRQTGDLASVSVPRNLRRLPMPRGALRRQFPRGFDDLANALYPYVVTHPKLGLDPAQTVKGALAELLGVPIDNYILVDMAGFVKIIDALGGVTVELSRRVPLVPNMDGSAPASRSIGPGPVHLDGPMALSFVRTREADSDYGRMGRQRCLLASLARNTSPSDLLRAYPFLAAAVEDAFRTDIPREQLGDLVTLFAKVDMGQTRTLALVPPVITPGNPNIARIRTLVASLLDPAVAGSVKAVTKPTC